MRTLKVLLFLFVLFTPSQSEGVENFCRRCEEMEVYSPEYDEWFYGKSCYQDKLGGNGPRCVTSGCQLFRLAPGAYFELCALCNVPVGSCIEYQGPMLEGECAGGGVQHRPDVEPALPVAFLTDRDPRTEAALSALAEVGSEIPPDFETSGAGRAYRQEDRFVIVLDPAKVLPIHIIGNAGPGVFCQVVGGAYVECVASQGAKELYNAAVCYTGREIPLNQQ
jgi:hypothetical protein